MQCLLAGDCLFYTLLTKMKKKKISTDGVPLLYTHDCKTKRDHSL